MYIRNLGRRIALERKKNCFTQTQLANLLFVSPNTISKWEREQILPDSHLIKKLTEIFKLDIDHFDEDLKLAESQMATINANSTRRKCYSDKGLTLSKDWNLLKYFSNSLMSGFDFSGKEALAKKFFKNVLCDADFSDSNLTGSTFKQNTLTNADYLNTDLTDCIFSSNNLDHAKFRKSKIRRSQFYASQLNFTIFSDLKLEEVQFKEVDLRTTIFQYCEFAGVSFTSADLSGLNLDGQVFSEVIFNKSKITDVSFKNAILKNVSFHSKFPVTRSCYKILKSICFDGAQMDLKTYNTLQRMCVDMSKIILIK